MSDIRSHAKHPLFPSRVEEIQLPIKSFSEKSRRSANSTGASVKNGAENSFGAVLLALAPDAVDIDDGRGSFHTATTLAN